MNKLLNVNNFGIYYKTGETRFLARIEDDDTKKAILQGLSEYDESGRSTKQADDYLIKPIRLEVKLTQNDPEAALQA